MFVLVSCGGEAATVAPSVVLVEPENVRALHVQLEGVEDAAAGEALAAAGFGTLEADHACLETDALRRAGVDSDVWREAFDGMLAYAGSQGWIEGSRVRAHLVRDKQKGRPPG